MLCTDSGGQPDWLLPPSELPESLLETVQPQLRCVAGRRLFRSWSHTDGGWADLFALQVALLERGPPFDSLWARETMARAACAARAAGRSNQLTQDDFCTLISCLGRLHSPHDFSALLRDLQQRGEDSRVWPHSVLHAGDDPVARARRAAARSFGQWAGDQGSVLLSLLRRAACEAASVGCVSEATAEQRRRQALQWRHPLSKCGREADPSLPGLVAAPDSDDSADSIDSRSEWQPWRPRSVQSTGGVAGTMRREVARLFGQRQFFGMAWWRRRVGVELAGRFVFAVFGDVVADVKKLKEVLRAVTKHFADLRAVADEHLELPFKREALRHSEEGEELTHLQCAYCGRCLLRAGPSGECVPWDKNPRQLRCPGCEREHVRWHPVPASVAVARLSRLGNPLGAGALGCPPLVRCRRTETSTPRTPVRRTRRSKQVQPVALDIVVACGRCGRTVLNMDCAGRPLPRSDVFSMMCPGCQTDHSDWTPGNPFNADGVPTAIAKAAQERPWKVFPTTRIHGREAASEDDAVADQAAALRYLECMECGRKMLRQGTVGETLPLPANAFGGFTPLDCPGCRRRHLKWRHRPDPAVTPLTL